MKVDIIDHRRNMIDSILLRSARIETLYILEPYQNHKPKSDQYCIWSGTGFHMRHEIHIVGWRREGQYLRESCCLTLKLVDEGTVGKKAFIVRF